jgi:Dinucleotide-utilizing enzymes involved in molybdopterin and thiamine biosynthesis family 2
VIGKLRKKNKVLLPEEMLKEHYVGKLYGKYHENPGVFNIYSQEMITAGLPCDEIGIVAESNENCEDCLLGIWNGENITFRYSNEEYQVEQYSLIQNIFSRNTGILESSIMQKKETIILGCGSVGSLVALQLAKSGVGKFLLVDNDILEYHNLCRHQCGISDVGKYKTDALKERILNINSSAEVTCETCTFEMVSKEIFDIHCIKGDAMIVGCADNRASDVYANSIAVMYHIPFVSIGFWERAFAGEIFYYLPDKDMPCYKCALGDGGNLSNRINTNRRIYTNEEDLTKVVFEPGISVDIDFVTVIGIKIILDILNMESNGYTSRLLDSLQQFTLVCNTNKAEIGGEMAEIFSYPLQVTTSLKVSHGTNCPPCEFL